MAAIAAYKFIGRKDKNAIDGAAVEAMTIMLNNMPLKCRIIVGEGELDEAPIALCWSNIRKRENHLWFSSWPCRRDLSGRL
ncbi:fructose-bisphosphatase class II [Spiroplasma endosymbiont of Nebria brevicollis]|uniref:fructose-bisphosphatase class II n=1 Tax=Spiroplasma endosymbiont of Nebria brevicollis TaxID=3066284 RepID=UPI00313C1E95